MQSRVSGLTIPASLKAPALVLLRLPGVLVSACLLWTLWVQPSLPGLLLGLRRGFEEGFYQVRTSGLPSCTLGLHGNVVGVLSDGLGHGGMVCGLMALNWLGEVGLDEVGWGWDGVVWCEIGWVLMGWV